MVRRQAILGLIAIVIGGGCHAGNSGGLKKSDPPLSKETISTARIIAQHNKNAVAIQTLKATPSIVFAAEDDKGKINQGSLKGRMAIERERDFRLEISSTLTKQADIGSNDKGFWFWVKDNPEHAIYVCDYDQVNASPLAVTMQPDWILEALGLREISEREAKTISASKGDRPGELILTQLRTDAKGLTLTKVTVVDEVSGEILEHRLYSGAKEKLLAKATISQSQGIEMMRTDDDPKGSVLSFPSRIKLEWFVEKFSLDIAIGKPIINQSFDKVMRAAFFTEPPIRGAVRKDLATLGPPPTSASSRIYESAPRSGGIQLGKPETDSTGLDGARSSLKDANSMAGGLSTAPIEPDTYVGPQPPKGVDPEAVQASSRGGFGRGMFQRQ